MIDARERVTGTIEYALDVSVPRMAHGRILRSPHAHARIVRIDLSRALRLRGVVSAVSGADLTDGSMDPWYGPFIRDQPPLAIGTVRYVGEPVAAAAALDEETAAEALDLIDVEYEILPAVLDVDAALLPDAPILHPGKRLLGSTRRDIVARQDEVAGTNLIHVFRQRRGDAEAGLAGADVVVEGTYESPAVQHVPMEPHVSVASFAGDRLTVWTSSQAPSSMASALAGIFRLPVSDVRVVVPTLGGGFGAKIDLNLEPIVALLSRRARRPVRIALDRAEDFYTASKHAARVRIRTGVMRDGRLVAHHATCWYDGGAYARDTPEKIFRGYVSMGPYRVDAIHVDSYGVYTNRLPACAFRGFGVPQMAWGHESHMDRIADALEMDPLDLRLRNVLGPSDRLSTGETLPEDPHYAELLQGAANAVGWERRGTRRRTGRVVRGTGISAIIKGMSSFPATCTVKLNEDGSLNILTSSVEMGQGALTALAQIAAHESTLPLALVRVSTPDTSVTPYDQMTAASRTTNVMGRAIRSAVRDVKAQLVALAADRFEIAPGDLLVEDGRVSVRGSADRSLTFAALIRGARAGNLLATGRHQSTIGLDTETGQGVGSPQWHSGVCSCEVEVDEETGRVTIFALHVGVYVGRMINPTQCELQVDGAKLFGLGQALFEELLWDEDGVLLNRNLADYMIPSILDVPERLADQILETPGTIDVHGIGETPLPAIAPAVANAIADATGVRLTTLPMTPEKLLRAIRERGSAT